MSEVHFDADAHTYTVAGRQYPSVTQILGAVGTRKDIDEPLRSLSGAEFFRDNPEYREFGNALHAYCAMRMRGMEPADIEYDPQMQPWVDSWEWWLDNEWPTLAAPTRRELILVIDWKTGNAPSQSWRMQTAAYAALARNWLSHHQAEAEMSDHLLFVETPMYHRVLAYAGTPDVVLIRPKGRRILRVCVILQDGAPAKSLPMSADIDSVLWTSALNLYKEFAS